MTGSGAVAIAVAAAIPGTLLSNLLKHQAQNMICFGHPSGTLKVGAETEWANGDWRVTKAVMSRSARRLMEGFVRVPG